MSTCKSLLPSCSSYLQDIPAIPGRGFLPFSFSPPRTLPEGGIPQNPAEKADQRIKRKNQILPDAVRPKGSGFYIGYFFAVGFKVLHDNQLESPQILPFYVIGAAQDSLEISRAAALHFKGNWSLVYRAESVFEVCKGGKAQCLSEPGDVALKFIKQPPFTYCDVSGGRSTLSQTLP